MVQKNFIPRNDGFVCEHCGITVGPAPGTFRNHCPACLTSKHVDKDIPGDRAATCQGLMPTIRCEGVDPDRLVLVQQCQTCHYTNRNRLSPDDDRQMALKIIQHSVYGDNGGKK